MRRGFGHARSARTAWVVLAITLAVAPVAAHVAPSVDDNNRYLKVSPAAASIRLAYTVFFGEVPGAQTRRTIDGNRDGTISEAESQRFALGLAGEVAASLELEVDGRPHRVTWAVVSAGMGSPQTTGGSFSVDLVAYLCLAEARGPHRLRLRDRFRVPRPGETEVKLEDGPGIRIDRARIGALADVAGEFKFVGPGGPLADAGLE
nr:hypothetical protein [Deltaproteobacteria bacterium]